MVLLLAAVLVPVGFAAEPATAGAQGSEGILGPLGPLLPGLDPPVVDDPKQAKRRPGVRARSSPPRQRALVKTLPISRRRGARPVSVASLPLRPLGQLRNGVGLEVSGELQVTVCLRPSSGPRRRRGDCVGRVYKYDPRIRVRLALASTAGAAKGRTFPLGPAQTLNCRQRQPNRNHHCVIALPWRRVSLGGSRGMPACAPKQCRLNLIASASDPRAGRRQRVVIGGIDKRGRIDNRGESRLSAIRYKRGARTADPERARLPLMQRLPLVGDGRKIKMRSVYSLPLADLREGQRLKFDGRFSGAIGTLPYNLRNRTRLILADRPAAIRPGPLARRTTRGSAYVSAVSNFNCTRGPSGHRTPCPIRKSGVLRISGDAPGTLYANLVAGYGAIGTRSGRYRRGDRVEIRRGGFLKVWRYGRGSNR